MKKKILLGLLFLFLAIQLVRTGHNDGDSYGPNHIAQGYTVPAEVDASLKKACYDCHSNHTVYPWYNAVQPVGLWLDNHIKEGKQHLNFSEFNTYPAKKQHHKLEEIRESLEEGWMPMKSYVWMHADAKLTEAEKTAIITWTQDLQKSIELTKNLN